MHKVHLVGAGPGDPELLTRKAWRVIRAASVILVDELVGAGLLDAVLEGLEPRPRVVAVGKRGGCRSTPQAFIERMMVREARAGERVVRLKGGDPLVFGRAGEERAALAAAGIECEVVNGITAGLAAASAVGASWTDRRCGAAGVMLVTGHSQPGSAGPDWGALGGAATAGITLVIYMGVARAGAIVEGLRARLPASTPAAVVQQAASPAERRALCTLGSLVETIEAGGFASPAILLVGPVLDPAWLGVPAAYSEPALSASLPGITALGMRSRRR